MYLLDHGRGSATEEKINVLTIVIHPHGMVKGFQRQLLLCILLHLDHNGIVRGEFNASHLQWSRLMLVGVAIEELAAVNGDGSPPVGQDFVGCHADVGFGLKCNKFDKRE
jgi:hypothetical protein